MNKKTFRLIERLKNLGFTFEESAVLRRIEMTLHRWCEAECGDCNDYCSWAIEREDETGKPFKVIYPHDAKDPRKYPVADREKGALARAAKIMAGHPELMFYYQTDCRGCALYIIRKSDIKADERIDSVYTRGLAVCD